VTMTYYRKTLGKKGPRMEDWGRTEGNESLCSMSHSLVAEDIKAEKLFAVRSGTGRRLVRRLIYLK